jgi:hypothetical protein
LLSLSLSLSLPIFQLHFTFSEFVSVSQTSYFLTQPSLFSLYLCYLFSFHLSLILPSSLIFSFSISLPFYLSLLSFSLSLHHLFTPFSIIFFSLSHIYFLLYLFSLFFFLSFLLSLILSLSLSLSPSLSLSLDFSITFYILNVRFCLSNLIFSYTIFSLSLPISP